MSSVIKARKTTAYVKSGEIQELIVSPCHYSGADPGVWGSVAPVRLWRICAPNCLLDFCVVSRRVICVIQVLVSPAFYVTRLSENMFSFPYKSQFHYIELYSTKNI